MFYVGFDREKEHPTKFPCWSAFYLSSIWKLDWVSDRGTKLVHNLSHELHFFRNIRKPIFLEDLLFHSQQASFQILSFCHQFMSDCKPTLIVWTFESYVALLSPTLGVLNSWKCGHDWFLLRWISVWIFTSSLKSWNWHCLYSLKMWLEFC